MKEETSVAVAVSGGGDSMALLFLLKSWAEDQGKTLLALIVDHRLRPESSQEAQQALEMARKLGVRSRLLRWEGGKPQGGLQARAREKRYELLAAACWREGIRTLFLGHHQGDQLETLLLRREKGSLPYGLAGMAPVAWRLGIRLVRPLLHFPKARLQATLRQAGIEWVEDPSNQDPRFDRVRVRRELTLLSPETRDVFLEELAGYVQARQRMDQEIANCLQQAWRGFPGGYAALHLGIFKEFSIIHKTLVLQKLLRAYGGQRTFFKREQLERWCQLIFEGACRVRRTLGGCHLVEQEGHLWFRREWGLLPKPCVVIPDATGVVSLIGDRRFYVEACTQAPCTLAYNAEGIPFFAYGVSIDRPVQRVVFFGGIGFCSEAFSFGGGDT